MNRDKSKRINEKTQLATIPVGETRTLFYEYHPGHLKEKKYFRATGYFCYLLKEKSNFIRAEFLIKEFKSNSPALDYELTCYN